MNENEKLINYIYQNSQMGIISINQLLKVVKDTKFQNQLHYQLNEYTTINTEVKKISGSFDTKAKDLSMFVKFRTNVMISLQTMSNKSASHLAQMMVIGSNMGVINAIKGLKKFEDADKPLLKLMKNLLDIEEENIKSLKLFL